MSFDEEHRGEHDECAHRIHELEAALAEEKLVTASYNSTVKVLRERIAERETSIERAAHDYDLLALELGDCARSLDWYTGKAKRRQDNAIHSENARLKSRYRKRLTRMQGLLRERKTFIGWLLAKWRRWSR